MDLQIVHDEEERHLHYHFETGNAKRVTYGHVNQWMIQQMRTDLKLAMYSDECERQINK